VIDDTRVELTNEFVVPEELFIRASRAYFRFSISRLPFWNRLLIFWSMFLLVTIAFQPAQFIRLLPVTLLLALVFQLLMVFLAYRGWRKHFTRLYAPGTVFATGFGPSSMAVKEPESRSETPYTAYSGVLHKHRFVFLKHRHSNSHVMLPEELVPPADLERLRAAIHP